MISFPFREKKPFLEIYITLGSNMRILKTYAKNIHYEIIDISSDLAMSADIDRDQILLGASG